MKDGRTDGRMDAIGQRAGEAMKRRDEAGRRKGGTRSDGGTVVGFAHHPLQPEITPTKSCCPVERRVTAPPRLARHNRRHLSSDKCPGGFYHLSPPDGQKTPAPVMRSRDTPGGAVSRRGSAELALRLFEPKGGVHGWHRLAAPLPARAHAAKVLLPFSPTADRAFASLSCRKGRVGFE